MSWEVCGFRPGKIHGRAKCRQMCGDCDGAHHFLYDSVDPETMGAADEATRARVADGHAECFVCKHCPTWAEIIDDEEGE